MRTSLSPKNLQSSAGQQAQQILRNCVHCGFCNATCPTYQLVGDELDGPRGRIYLIKNFLENGKDANTLMHHLDRCLTCRNCETTCPSGVEYSQLAELGRMLGEKRARRSIYFKTKRWLIKTLLSSRHLFSMAAWCGRHMKLLLPAKSRDLLSRRNIHLQLNQHTKPVTISTLPKLFLFEGCVQPTLAPQINIATRYILEQLGYSMQTLKSEQCCGAIHLHNADLKQASKRMQNNIASWHAHKDKNSFIVSTASGCGVTLKEYHKTLRHHSDKQTIARAQQFSQQVKDLSEILVHHNTLAQFIPESIKQLKIAVHLPCTLQHGMQLKSTFEQLIDQLPLQIVQVSDAHLCCGSAGTYSLFQKKLSKELLQRKVTSLTTSEPDLIITANIGCLLELSHHSDVPIVHWIELFCPQESLSKEILLAISKNN